MLYFGAWTERRAVPATEADHPALADKYRALRSEARLYRWYLEIQREAVG